MEQTEAFKNVEATIKALEKRLLICGTINKVCEQSAEEAEKEIKEYFARCFNALAAREASLLRDVAQKVHNQSMLKIRSIFIFVVIFIVS